MKRRVRCSAFLGVTLLAVHVGRAQGISAQDLARARADVSSRPTISTISPGCLAPGSGGSIALDGLSFGAAQGGRAVVLTLAGRRLNSRVTSWSNGRILLRVDPFASLSPVEAASIALEIRNEAGEAYPGASKQLHACRTRFEQTVVLNTGNCTAVGPSLPVESEGGTSPYDGSTLRSTWDVPAAGSGQFRLEARMSVPFSLTPKPVGGCPEGHWEPARASVTPTDAAWQQTVLFRYVIPTRRVTVPAATITTFVRAALADAAIHLNNYGPKAGKSFLKRGDAWMKFGPAGGGRTFPIAIEEIRLDPPDPLGRILYYVKNVDSSGVTFTHDAGHYHLAVAFANTPEGVKGEHEGAGISPSMAVNGAKVAVTLRFTPASGPKPDTVVEKVEFSGRIEGGCNVAVFDVCALVTALLKNGLPERGVPGLEQRVKEALSDPATRAAIGDAIWSGLDSPLGRLAISNAAGGVGVSRLLRVSAASADGLEVEFVPGR